MNEDFCGLCNVVITDWKKHTKTQKHKKRVAHFIELGKRGLSKWGIGDIE